MFCYIASYLAESLVGRSSSSAQTTGIPWAPTLYIIVTVFSPSGLVHFLIRVWSIIIIVTKVRRQHEDLLYAHPHYLFLTPFHACCRLEGPSLAASCLSPSCTTRMSYHLLAIAALQSASHTGSPTFGHQSFYSSPLSFSSISSRSSAS